MTPLCVRGYVQDRDASVCLDPSVPESRVSLAYCENLAIGRSVLRGPGSAVRQSTRGPFRVRSLHGEFCSYFAVDVGYVGNYDVVLGADWFAACGAVCYAGVVLDPPSEAVLRAGHAWVADLDRGSSRWSIGPSAPLVASGSGSGHAYSSTAPVSGYPDGDLDTESLYSAAVNSEWQDIDPLRSKTDMAKLTHDQLRCRCVSHGINNDSLEDSAESLRVALTEHMARGLCASMEGDACRAVSAAYRAETDAADACRDLRIKYLADAARTFKKRPLIRLLKAEGLACSLSLSLNELRRLLDAHVATLRKAKQSAIRVAKYQQQRADLRDARLSLEDSLRREWPRSVPDTMKAKLVRLFREETSSSALRTFCCGCCGASRAFADRECVPLADDRLQLLSAAGDMVGDLFRRNGTGFGPRADLVLEPSAVDTAAQTVAVCNPCLRSLGRSSLPALALANSTWTGPVPDELKDLTSVEESMISLCRAKCWMLHLRNDKDGAHKTYSPTMQRGYRGSVIEFPQRPDRVATVLPPSIDEIEAMVCILFVGSTPPSKEWLVDKAKPLGIRRNKVWRALLWLKEHNYLYKDVAIDHDRLSRLPENGCLDVPVHTLEEGDDLNAAIDRYDNAVEDDPPEPDNGDLHTTPVGTDSPRAESGSSNSEVLFRTVVISDVDGSTPVSELSAAAMHHMKVKKAGYLEVGHDPVPVNEFCNPSLFPMMFPTLYPYGVGGFEDSRRSVKVSLKRHAAHLLTWHDKRFQEHATFMFIVFNILQRREVLLRSSLKVKKNSFARVASEFSKVPLTAVSSVCAKLAENDFSAPMTKDELTVMSLMKEVNLVTSSVPGSSSSRVNMRNQLRATMLEHGLPSFYLTVNPADVDNPIVSFLAGDEIDLDKLLPDDTPSSNWNQSVLVARNPCVASKFFNLYMKAFIKVLLGFDPKVRSYTDEGGVFGHVKAYYGCVEAQGRGSLHCHMVIWLEGALNPNEIRDKVLGGDAEFANRILSFLDDAISTCVPALSPDEAVGVDQARSKRKKKKDSREYMRKDPCRSRGVDMSLAPEIRDPARKRDLHDLAKRCQSHEHSPTCFKYCRPGEPRLCRFDLDPENVSPTSYFDPQTGEMNLRCLDGMVNNFNDTMMEALRCNMDVKFVGSGEAAKAIVYYITNYITKPQMKAHVAYAAIELAIKRLSELPVEEMESASYGLALLRKCAFSLVNHQELSAQQVASYLLGNDDSFCSHNYENLYWTSFERYVDKLCPSPECYLPRSDRGDLLSLPVIPDETGRSLDTSDDLGAESAAIMLESDDEAEGEMSIADDDEFDFMEDLENEENPDKPGSENDISELDVLAPSNDELTLDTSPEGDLRPKADQVCDYLYRPLALDGLPLWDFVSRVKKERVRGVRQAQDDAEVDLDPGSDEAVEDNDNVIDRDESLTTDELDRLLSSCDWQRPTFHLAAQHPECARRMLRVRHPTDARIVVPIGPAIPRRDKDDVRSKYSRLMLILFKPWRKVADLRDNGESWVESFERFQNECASAVKLRMSNMQLFHECKDNSKDHFRHRAHLRRAKLGADLVSFSPEDEDGGVDMDEEDILRHITDDDPYSPSRADDSVDPNAIECVCAAVEGGMYASISEHARALVSSGSYASDLVDRGDGSLESYWLSVYDERKRERKKKLRTAVESIAPAEDHLSTLSTTSTERSAVQSLGNTDSSSSSRLHPGARIVPGLQNASDKKADALRIEDFVDKWTLNSEQACAFRIISQHSLRPYDRNNQLKMYLGGAGGTGKSRVINALRDFFRAREESRRFRLCSFTGVASRNISGMTLHSALNFNHTTSRVRRGSRAHQDLQAAWEGVDYLFVDEISMVGCFLLARVSEALCLAKGVDAPFGGVNVIFAGDFAQLAPVGEAKLYGRLSAKAMGSSGDSKSHRSVFGKLLWLSIDTVVMLTRPMRQRGDSNARFVELLTRLRVGMCTRDDFDLLNKYLLREKPLTASDSRDWFDAPVIVYGNACKDKLNELAVSRYAALTGRTVQWYCCQDEHKGVGFSDQRIRNKLRNKPSGKTQGLLGRIPIVLGMRVVVSKNFDVEGGILNGSIGVLRKIRYVLDDYGDRHLKSCVVELPDSDAEQMPGLGSKEFPITEECKDWSIYKKMQNKQRRLTVTRTQVPIQPAYAFTCHRAQGQTFSRVMVDLQSCPSLESAYVMLSRATSLDGVRILRPFEMSKLATPPGKELTHELLRLQIMHNRTWLKHEPNPNVSSTGEQEQLSKHMLSVVSATVPEHIDDQRRMLAEVQTEIETAVTKAIANRAKPAGSLQPSRSSNDKKRGAPGEGSSKSKRPRTSV